MNRLNRTRGPSRQAAVARQRAEVSLRLSGPGTKESWRPGAFGDNRTTASEQRHGSSKRKLWAQSSHRTEPSRDLRVAGRAPQPDHRTLPWSSPCSRRSRQ